MEKRTTIGKECTNNRKNLENKEKGKTDINVTYIGNFSTDYRDRKSGVEYDSDSRGILISVMKNFGKFTVGGAAGYQDSKVNYKGQFEGIDEKINSYQIMLSGKYEFNENIEKTRTERCSIFASHSGKRNASAARSNWLSKLWPSCA